MADFVAQLTSHSPGAVSNGLTIAVARERTPRQGVPIVRPFPLTEPLGGAWDDRNEALLSSTYQAVAPETGFGPHWFELMHYKPLLIDVGNILTTVVREIEIYNAYRRTSQTLTDADALAGPGVTLNGVPTLPHEIGQQNSVTFDAVISIDGPPTILGTIELVTDPASFSIPVTGSRIIMFAYQPESPVGEQLQFLTDVLVAADGTEQRVSWRKNPRQLLDMTYRLVDDHDRRTAQNLLRGWHQRVFGVPIWFEARTLETSVSAAATTIPIDTAYADYRAGGLCIIWESPEVWDALEIDTVNANSLVLTSGLINSYTAGEALVMPLRTAQLDERLAMQTYLNNLQDVRLAWTVLDNDVGAAFGDTSPFGVHNSKVLLDGPNVSDRTVEDGIDRAIYSIDNQITAAHRFTTELVSVPSSRKGFYGGTRQTIWEARRLVHALRGSQVSFYLPTFLKDLVPTQDLVATSTDLNIEHVGYTDFVDGVEPYKSIWIELVDGTVITRQVVGSVIIDANNERLTVDVAWSPTIDLADIAKISLLRLMRISDDRVQFIHEYPGTAQITMSVRGAQ